MTFVSGWRLALRLAWREAWRSKARSVLVLVMVTFPVVAVIGADVAQATSSVSAVEGLDRRIGSAEAKVTVLPDVHRVFQTPDPDSGFAAAGGHGPSVTPAEIENALGPSRPVTEVKHDQVPIRTDLGVLRVDTTAADWHSGLTHGLYRLTSGRLPVGAHEVAINAALAGRGYAVGDTLTEADGTELTVVGTAESTGSRTEPQLIGDARLLGPGAESRSWLVGGGPVTWQQVLAANQLGALVLSRYVIEHPPPTDQLPPQVRGIVSADRATLYAVLALVAAMALIEVVLLAGPAFAVGARRQSRSLALIAANGGTPVQSRRVVLGTAVVIGVFAAVTGVVLGIASAWALLPWLQTMSDSYFGPFQIRWEHVLGIAAFGMLSAFLAAVVPAWVASRQDVVAVLAGRRGDRAASRRSPFVGLVLVAVGVLVAVLGAHQGTGVVLIAVSAILTVLGMIFLVPVVVVSVARLGRRFPLPLRYAVRDAARHRTRTVPAVAAVAATVAGVVALSIGNSSDQAQAKAQYQPRLADGTTSVAMSGHSTDWSAVESAVSRVAPDAEPSRVIGVGGSRPLRVASSVPNTGAFVSNLPVQALVSDGRALPPLLRGQVSEATWKAAAPVLARGGVVILAPSGQAVDHARVTVGGRHGASVRVPAAVADTGGAVPRVVAVLSPAAARALHVRPRTVGLLLTGQPLAATQTSDLQQVLTALDRSANVYTERGYQVPSSEKVVLLILFGLAAVLMLGGTLTATFLALADARPDLATLSAVGASPRTRRAVAAAYAVSVGVVGAVLGVAVGFVPGIAISYPLTRSYDSTDPSHVLSVPWLEIAGLVVLLPVLTALVVGLLARSRLPLVARLD